MNDIQVKDSKFYILRSPSEVRFVQDYRVICETLNDGECDPSCAGAILSQFEGWHNTVIKEGSKDETIALSEDDLWFFRSDKKLTYDMYNIWSTRKIADNRLWLIKVGLVEVKQIATTYGLQNYYRLNRVMIQKMIGGSCKNDATRHAKTTRPVMQKQHTYNSSDNSSKELTTLSSTEMTSELLPSETAPIQVTVIQETPPTKSAKKEIAPNLGYELGLLVHEWLGLETTWRDIGYALIGKGRYKSVAEAFKAQPVTCDEFKLFMNWYTGKYPNYTGIKSPSTLGNHIADYRKEAATVTQVTPAQSSYSVFA